MKGDQPKGKVPVDRRTVLKGVGVAATATAIQGSGALFLKDANSAEAAERRKASGVLSDAPVAVVWRHTADLSQSERFIGRALHLREVAREPAAILYDAGTVLLGYTSGDADMDSDRTHRPWPARYRPQLNPLSTVNHLPIDFRASIERLSRETRGNLRVERGAAQFVDHDGNQFSFHRPSPDAFGDASAQRVEGIIGKTHRGTQGTSPVAAPIGAVELLVTDLQRSTRFYSEVFGLRLLSNEPEQTTFDLGTILLVLRPEPVGGLVELLRRSGRLQGDNQVFHVSNIKSTVDKLTALGVEYPFGIEDRSVGKVATMNDPDGHLWVLWQPSDDVEQGGYYPTLSRIVTAASSPT